MMQDMTKGSPVKLILLFSLPLLIGNVFQQLYNIADIIIVGRIIGVNALAAVGATAPVFFLLLQIIMGMTGGLAIITGQRFGAKDYDGMRRSVAVSIVICLIFTVLASIILIPFMYNILGLMQVPVELIHDSFSYISIISYGLIVMVLYNLLSSIIRALGDSKTPLYFLIFATILNIFLALLFIIKFKMGIAGSAIAVVIAQAASALLCLIYISKKFPILRLKKCDWIFDWSFMWEHIKVSVPMSLQMSIMALGVMVIQIVCNTFGPTVIAAFTSALRIEQIAIQPMATFGIAMAAYTAQNYGAKKLSRIRAGVRKCSIISLIVSVALALLMRFYGENLMGIFIDSAQPEIINIGKSYLNISTLFYFFMGQIFIFRNTLQGMGQVKIPLLTSLVQFTLRTSTAIGLPMIMGYSGLFYATPIAWVAAAAVVSAGYFMTIKNISLERLSD